VFKNLIVLVAGLAVVMPLWADTAASRWEGRTDLGYFNQSGSDGGKESLSFKSQLNRTWGDFTWENRAEALSSNDDNSNAGSARYLLNSKQRLALSKKDYVFVQEQFEKDSTSAFRYQFNLTTGYGRSIFSDDIKELVVEVGAGARYSDPKEGDKEVNAIATAGLNYRHKLTDTVSFNQRIGVEGGEDTIILRSLSEIRVQLREQLSMAAGYDMKREFSDNNSRLNVMTVSLGYSY
jgi:putative salt-induced outer membrane protein YdiY